MNREQRERHEGYEQREAGQTNFSRFSRISRLKLQRTLPLNSMNREHSEGYEQGEADQTNFSRLSRVSRLKIQRTLPFLFAVFAPFAVKFQRTLCFNFLNREQRERHERGPLLPSRLSVPSLEGRGNISLDSSSNRFKSTTDTPFFVRGFRAFRG